MQIRLAQYEDLESIAHLMLEIFEDRMQVKYSLEGRTVFKELISLSSLQKRFLSNNLFYISTDDGFIKGALELEKPCHIAFLFVQQERRGVGKALCTFALEKSTQEICTVGAFEEAIGFYEGLGFVQVAQEKKINNIAYTLMAKTNT